MAVYGPVRHQRNITWTSEASVHIILFWWRSVPYTAIWPSVPWIICYIWPSKLLHAFVLKSVLQQLLNYQQSEQLPLSSRYRTCKTSMTHAIEIPALACERHTNLERLNWFMEFNNPLSIIAYATVIYILTTNTKPAPICFFSKRSYTITWWIKT